MKPLNYKKRRKGYLLFVLVFGILILLLFLAGYLTIKTGEKGVIILEEKHKRYTDIYRKKAALSFEIDEIITRLNKMGTKERNLSQYKQFQSLISDIREQVIKRIDKDANPDDFLVYKEMIEEIKVIQDNYDSYKEDHEKFRFIESQLEKCKVKYIEEQGKKNK